MDANTLARMRGGRRPMTDQNPNDTTPGGDPFAHEPHGTDGADAGTNGAENASAKSREWLTQLQTMINDITTQAAPVAREVAAKAAELTAVAAVKAGPFAQRAANVTSDASQKLADRANSLAAELRGEIPGTPAEDVSWADAADAPPPQDTTQTHDDPSAGGTF
jgi:hypothetical protein